MFRAVRQATQRLQRLGYRLRMKRLRRPYLAVDRIFSGGSYRGRFTGRLPAAGLRAIT